MSSAISLRAFDAVTFAYLFLGGVGIILFFHDRGWHAGPAFRDVADLFDQARARLKPDGRIYVMVSSDSDLDLLGKRIDKAGFRAKLAHEYSIFIESFIIYELAVR